MCLIFIDTLPSTFAHLLPIRGPINATLNTLGLGQGDWPLFAPNPIINNGTIIAEIEDKNHRRFQWSSPDWSKQSVWCKFYEFRQINYFQRLPYYPLACENLADYLHRTIPQQQTVTPIIDLTPTGNDLTAREFTPPIRQFNLYHAKFELMTHDGPGLPSTEEVFWSYQMRLLLHQGEESSSN